MIISKPKPIEEVMEFIKDKDKVYITGCSQCASTCQTGGEKELQAMKEFLESQGKKVTGTFVLDPSCHRLQVRSTLKKEKDRVGEAEAILCMACGDGTQTISGLVDIPVYPANDTLFIGEIERLGHYTEACRACGKCELGWSAGICPITKCAKSLINGPCGGAKDGKCEVNPDNDCAWILIYNRLKKSGDLDSLLEIKEPKDHSQFAHPRRLMPTK
jgi:hypothetical protein